MNSQTFSQNLRKQGKSTTMCVLVLSCMYVTMVVMNKSVIMRCLFFFLYQFIGGWKGHPWPCPVPFVRDKLRVVTKNDMYFVSLQFVDRV